MDVERDRLRDLIEDSTLRLLDTARGLSDAAAEDPSLLPGWSRKHVLTHVARGGDALRNLLRSAWTGVTVPPYASPEAREKDIEIGALRVIDEIVADVVDSAAKFRAEAGSVPGDAWGREMRVLDYPPFPATRILIWRWVEIELHHVDLGVGYRTADWPAEFAALELPEPMASQRADRRSWEQDRHA
jgi:maleylpyruvate isomerase